MGKASNNLISDPSIDQDISFQINPSSISILSDNRHKIIQNAAQRSVRQSQSELKEEEKIQVQLGNNQKEIKKVDRKQKQQK